MLVRVVVGVGYRLKSECRALTTECPPIHLHTYSPSLVHGEKCDRRARVTLMTSLTAGWERTKSARTTISLISATIYRDSGEFSKDTMMAKST